MTRSAFLLAALVPGGFLPAQGEELAYWNFNTYDPGTTFTSSADAGLQASAAVIDWSAFNGAGFGVENPAPDFSTATGAYLATLPGGQTAGTGLGLNSQAGSGNLDIRLDGTGFDYLTVSGYADTGTVGHPKSWQFSTDGVNFSSVGAYTVKGNAITFNNHQLANQAAITLRLAQPQSYSPTAFSRYDNLAVSGNAYNGLVLAGEGDKRIVRGYAQNLNFTLSERTGAEQTYTLSSTGLTHLQDLANGTNPSPTIVASGANAISGMVETSAAAAGETLLATVTAQSATPGVDPISKTIAVQVLENRVITLAGSGNLGDLGRVVAGNPLAMLTLQTDGKSDSEATRITLNDGTYYAPAGWSGNSGAVGGLNFTVAAKSVFDSADETAEVVVRANPGGALGTQTFSADLKDAKTSQYVHSGLFTAETAIGSSLDNLGDLKITGTATVLVNRDLNATAIDLGREMTGTGADPVSGSGTVTVNGGAWGDLQATRVQLNRTTSPLTANGVSASVAADTLFDSANETAIVDVTYSTSFDRSVAGRQSASVSLGSQLSNAEDPSVAGVVVDGDLAVSVEKTFVNDRQIQGSSTVYVGALAGRTISEVSNHIYTDGDDAENTRIVVNGHLWDHSNFYEFQTDSVTVNQFSSQSKAATLLGAKIVDVVGEGLAGETPDSLTWQYGVYFQQSASAAVSATVGGAGTGVLGQGSTGHTLHVGDTVTVAAAAKNDGGDGGRASTQVYTGFVGNDGFSLQNLGSLVVAGDSATGTVAFDSTGKLNGLHSATLSLHLSNDQNLLGSVFGDVGYYSFGVEHVVTGNSGAGGTAFVASGSRLRTAGISSSFSNSVLSQATTAALKDSQILGSNVRIQLAFDSIENAAGIGAADLVSDTVSLEGLDGITFVLQVGYDEATLISKFGTEEVAILTWYDPEDGTWKNAIHGNSTYGVAGAENAYGKRFRMSYDAYLGLQAGGLPRLNDYGYDPEQNVMWAVLDHNSEFGGSGFGAVPEPSAALLAMVGAGALILRRRRSAR